MTKSELELALRDFTSTLATAICTRDGQWSVKGFIDAFKNIYTISSDTKVVSKILEIHLFPKLISFADKHDLIIVLPDHQNYYPGISFVSKSDRNVRFALDFKTTYRDPEKPWLCNGFTLGSHGKYFQDRTSTKNIQFPYGSYHGHFCLGVMYDRGELSSDYESNVHKIDDLLSITSVIANLQFFVAEKWKIAGDKGGSGNTANIGSIQRIDDILVGNGMFSNLGEEWFDDYWMNYGKIKISDQSGKTRKIKSLNEFVIYRGGDAELIVPKRNR